MVRSGLCIGCGACAAAEPSAVMRWDAYGQLRPQGPAAWMRGRTAGFSRACPFSPAAEDEDSIAARRFPGAAVHDPFLGRFEEAFVGHAVEPGFREQGSSGGMVSWVAVELLRRAMVDAVVHVAPADPAGEDGFFHYRISRTEAEVRAGAKSRYHPVELSSVLRAIRARPGRHAVVAIPCFAKAIALLRRADPLLRDRIPFTLGLFCGHMKSRRMVESFAWQMGTRANRVGGLDYRLKDPRRPANWYRAQLVLRNGSALAQDWWHLADGDWGAGFFQNPACDFCDDVVGETADICFGDAWVEPFSSDGRGTNVVIVRSPALRDLLGGGMADGRLRLEPVDADFVVRTQAAGFRHRREGLALRLAGRRRGIRPRKRVEPGGADLPLRRRLVYAMRLRIARWSHRMFWAARLVRWPGLYLAWARAAAGLYHGLAYSRGPVGRLADRLLPVTPGERE